MEFPSKRLAVSLLIFTATALAEGPKSVEAVLSDYAKSVGGTAAVDAITTRKIKASLSLLGKAELYWQKPDKVLLLAGRARTGYNGSTGWVYSKRKRLRRLGHGEQTPLEIDGNPLRYVHMHQLYAQLDAAPQKTVDDVLMDVLIAPNDLAQTIFYFDARTHLLARIDEKGETSAYNTQTVWLQDYEPVDGVLFPHRIIHTTSGKSGTTEDFRVKSIEDNIELNPEIFSKPQSAKLVFGGKR